MKRQTGLVFILLLFGAIHPLAAQPASARFEISVDKYLMGTLVKATVRHDDIEAGKTALVKAFQEMERVEALLSVQRASSEVSAINQNAGHRPVKVSGETFAIVQRAQSYAERFDGLFDVTIGPVTALWGFNGNQQAVLPDPERLAERLKLVDYRKIVLNETDTTVFLSTPGMQIDLGGIAKGYAIDRGVAVLRQQGLQQFLLNAGGDVYASGQKDHRTDWLVGVKHPRASNDLLARFNLRDVAAATSGDYERYALIDGTRYHHIIDPRTGYPGTLSQSVTVLAGSAEEADVWATYLFLTGPSSLQQAAPQEIPYLIVDAEGQVQVSTSFRAALQLLD